MIRYIRVPKFAELSGYTPKAVERAFHAGGTPAVGGD
jgi:hypothetical protein